jgi:hypothetical protein
MDTLPEDIFYGLLDQVADIRADLRGAIPGDTDYFAKIDAALGYCMPHFVLPNLTGEDLAMVQHSNAHQAVFGLILLKLEAAELRHTYRRLVDYLHARPASYEDVHWLARFLAATTDPMTAGAAELVICDCLVELSMQAGTP